MTSAIDLDCGNRLLSVRAGQQRASCLRSTDVRSICCYCYNRAACQTVLATLLGDCADRAVRFGLGSASRKQGRSNARRCTRRAHGRPPCSEAVDLGELRASLGLRSIVWCIVIVFWPCVVGEGPTFYAASLCSWRQRNVLVALLPRSWWFTFTYSWRGSPSVDRTHALAWC